MPSSNRINCLEDRKKYAKKFRYKIISKTYTKAKEKCRFQCPIGHKYTATWSDFKSGYRCNICSGHFGTSLKELKDHAKSKEGKCLSKSFSKVTAYYRWQCKAGHTWHAIWSNIRGNHGKKGTWCPDCKKLSAGSSQRLTIKDIHKSASENGGRCLSTTYTNNRAKLKFICKFDHIWDATAMDIRAGNWCPYCSGQKGKSLRWLKSIAKERGGNCISKSYEGVRVKHTWQCKLGHVWKAAPYSIVSGRWCPECSSRVGERISRLYFEKIFGCKFPKTKPDWLRNSKGNLLELDGYNSKLKIAFEHQGRQHTKECKKFFHKKGNRSFEEQKKDDNLKKIICKKKGIKLIEIPSIPDITPLPRVAETLDLLIKKHKLKPKRNIFKIKVDLSEAFSPDEFAELKLKCEHNGGKCLSKNYMGKYENLSFECDKGHQWETKPCYIFRGSWCAKCRNSENQVGKRKTIQDAKEIARANGGLCLSKSYKDNRSNLRWQCGSCKNKWPASYHSISSGSWCPECAPEKQLENSRIKREREIRECIKKYKFNLISKYINNSSQSKFKCPHGHIFKDKYVNLIRRLSRKGNGCTKCS